MLSGKMPEIVTHSLQVVEEETVADVENIELDELNLGNSRLTYKNRKDEAIIGGTYLRGKCFRILFKEKFPRCLTVSLS